MELSILKKKRRGGGIAFLLTLGALLLFLSSALLFLRNLSSRIAVSDAADVVTARINSVVARIMAEEEYPADSFVQMEKDGEGRVTAVSCNMARINALSARVLEEIVDATEGHDLTVSVPLGNLTGLSLLMGRGPAVPVKIVVLTSSRVEFQNSIVTAGINQTKHQIALVATVDIDVLVPWATESAQVSSEVLIADTVIVGQVPQSYWNLGGG